MALSELELKRIEKAADLFMSKRRPPPAIRAQVDLGSKLNGLSIELFEIRPNWKDPTIIMQHSFAKATFVKAKGLWKIYWMKSDLKWHSYSPAPEVKSIEEFFEIVSEDSQCCFFG